MNKQRKVLITITYNEMGIIIDTKAEEVAQSNLQPTCNQLATDCISRQEAVDAIQRSRFLVDAMEKIIKLPPTNPERKKGKWICEYDGKFTGGAYWYSCSKCKRIVPEVRNGGWNFCPNCGTDMRGEQDE